jgi:hypothetical protein
MKTTYAVIIVVVCAAIVLVGLNGLLNTKIENDSSASQSIYQKNSAIMGKHSGLDQRQSIPLAPLIPLIAPIVTLIFGILGCCCGLYYVFTSKADYRQGD